MVGQKTALTSDLLAFWGKARPQVGQTMLFHALLAQIGVGTLDQALLAVLPAAWVGAQGSDRG